MTMKVVGESVDSSLSYTDNNRGDKAKKDCCCVLGVKMVESNQKNKRSRQHIEF
jgi:hypothetical protein